MVYDHYPGNKDQYAKGTPSEHPYPKQDFTGYAPGELIAKSSAKDPEADLIVTSGTLLCEDNGGVLDGFTTTHNFRMLVNPLDSNKKPIGWTDYRITALGTVMRWHSGKPAWAGMHLFARYTTSDNLYVASYRSDGLITIKKKVNAQYTTLASADIGPPETDKEYVMAFEVEGTDLRYFIDGKLALTASDNDLSWGTSGVRFDYSDTFVDYIKVNDV
jgi:hypothetical protein